jgi:hypothetical protein
MDKKAKTLINQALKKDPSLLNNKTQNPQNVPIIGQKQVPVFKVALVPMQDPSKIVYAKLPSSPPTIIAVKNKETSYMYSHVEIVENSLMFVYREAPTMMCNLDIQDEQKKEGDKE